jgi:hypothetical protein
MAKCKIFRRDPIALGTRLTEGDAPGEGTRPSTRVARLGFRVRDAGTGT